MSNLVHNEQVKLAATFWNNLAVAALLSVFRARGGDRLAHALALVAAAAAGVNWRLVIATDDGFRFAQPILRPA